MIIRSYWGKDSLSGYNGHSGQVSLEAPATSGPPRGGTTANSCSCPAARSSAAAHGALQVTGDDLSRLLGRPVTPLADVLEAALPGLP